MNPELILESTAGTGSSWAIANVAVTRHNKMEKTNALGMKWLQ